LYHGDKRNGDGARIEARGKIACAFLSGYNISVAKLQVREKRWGLSDTPQKIQDHQIALLRKASVSERISRAFMLSEAMINLSRQGLKRRHPKLSPEELDVLFVEHCYGPELAQKFRAHLKERRN